MSALGLDRLRALAAVDDMRLLWPLLDSVLEEQRLRLAGGEADELLAAASSIVIYGAGEFARAVIDAWQDRALPIRYLVDRNPCKWGHDWSGYPVVSPDVLETEAQHRPLIVVAVMDTHGIAPALERLGLAYLFAERDGSVGFLPGHLLLRRRDACEEIFSQLSDDRSRFVYLSVVIARFFQDFYFPMRGNLFTDRCASYPQYFSGLVELADGERYVDCGLFDGDSLAAFVAEAYRLGISDWSAVGMEADPSNVAQARANLAALGLERIPVREVVLGSGRESIGSLRLPNCVGGVIPDSGDTVALDDLLGDWEPSYVKMDIEGAELSALIGAHSTIERHRPRLAVCIYHTTADLIEIPLLLSKRYPFYDLYIRHHRGDSLWETICYAIPRHTSGVDHYESRRGVRAACGKQYSGLG